jgi:N-methylhydantoinase A
LQDGVDDALALDSIASRFHATHERLYAFRLDRPISVVNLHLVATMALAKPELAPLDTQGRDATRARRARREVGFDKHGWQRTEVIDLRYWPVDTEQAGPCILQGADTAMAVPPGYTAHLDAYGNVRVRRNEARA